MIPVGDETESSEGKKSGEGGADWCVGVGSTWGFNTVASEPMGEGGMNGIIMTGKTVEIKKTGSGAGFLRRPARLTQRQRALR